MGKASHAKSESHRRERIAAQRAADQRRERQRRLLLAGGAVLTVVAIVVAFVLVKATSGASGAAAAGGAGNGPAGAALASVVSDATGVPAATLDAVGAGGASLGGAIKPVTGAPLTAGGKPEVLFVSAEYCPFCAAERWALVVALSRFGAFHGLRTIHSSATDRPASIPTWTFYGSSYTSDYLAFTPVEETTNTANASGSYPTLQVPTPAQQAIVAKYDPGSSPGTGGPIPFVDFGSKHIQIGDLPMLGPANLTGDWATIAADLKNPSSGNAKAVLSAANFTTAAICQLTGNLPTTACTPSVRALEAQLHG
jgi:hypothetical protein